MSLEDAVLWGHQAILTVAMVCGPVLLAALVIGVAISLLQAVTQVHEMTLVFVPKILGVFLVVLFLGGWMLERAVAFGTHCFEAAADVTR